MVRNNPVVKQVIQLSIKFVKLKMKFLSLLVLCICFVATGFLCAKSSGNDELPEVRPENITFQLSMSGGMMYYFEDLYISRDSCYYLVNDGGAVSKIYFKLAGKELDDLYNVFLNNDFDRIETYTEQVYDRGGETINLRWGKSRGVSVSNSGQSFIEKSWGKEWSSCENALAGIIKEQVSKQQADYEIRVDKTVFGKEIFVQIDRLVIIPKSTVMSENSTDSFITRSVKLTPGSHRVSFSLGANNRSFDLSTDSSKGLNFFLVNDTLLSHSNIK